MNETQQYFATEIALDHADGLIPRREALRRLVLLGLSVATASTLLAACESETAGVGAPSDASSEAVSIPPPGVTVQPDAALPTEPITFPGVQGRTLMGAWAAAAKPLGAVLVIHENRGLTDHIANVASRFAAAGYSALALDLLSEEGGTASSPSTQIAAVLLAAEIHGHGVAAAHHDAEALAGSARTSPR